MINRTLDNKILTTTLGMMYMYKIIQFQESGYGEKTLDFL